MIPLRQRNRPCGIGLLVIEIRLRLGQRSARNPNLRLGIDRGVETSPCSAAVSTVSFSFHRLLETVASAALTRCRQIVALDNGNQLPRRPACPSSTDNV